MWKKVKDGWLYTNNNPTFYFMGADGMYGIFRLKSFRYWWARFWGKQLDEIRRIDKL